MSKVLMFGADPADVITARQFLQKHDRDSAFTYAQLVEKELVLGTAENNDFFSDAEEIIEEEQTAIELMEMFHVE